MTRFSSSFFRSGIAAFLVTSGLALAQDQPPTQPAQPPSNGGWRRAGDPATEQQTAPPAMPPQTDPTQPVDRSDGYGQPAQPQAQQPQDMPQQQMPPSASYRPPYGLPAVLTVRSGTFVTVRTNEPLASNKNKAGDIFTGTLAQPLIANGIVVAQRGQTVMGRVVETGKNKDGKHFIALQLTGITVADGTQLPVQSQLAAAQGGTTPGEVQAGTIIGTTATGAAIGGIAAWGTGAAIGAGAGAIAGIAAVIATRDHPAVLYPESALTFQITTPLNVSTTNVPQAFRYAGPEDFQPQPTMARGPGPRPGYGYPRPGYPGPGYYAAPGYGYPGYYPYYWGPSFGVVVGGWRGGWRRW